MTTSICTRGDELYPHKLLEIHKSPVKIFYRGDIGILNSETNVAIIGSRNASEKGSVVAYDYGRRAAEAGLVVVNGLAMGCDTEAIKGALSCGGKCAVVLASGLDRITPKCNIGLAEEVLDKGGCLLSEYIDGTPPFKGYYVDRDRIQSGISQGVIVIETELDGGTMHTARFANSQLRRLACYYSKLSEMKSGNKYIIEKRMGIPLSTDEDLQKFFIQLKSEKNMVYEQQVLNLT